MTLFSNSYANNTSPFTPCISVPQSNFQVQIKIPHSESDQICHHCGKSKSGFTCCDSACKKTYCEKCLTSIYRYSHKNMKKYCTRNTWNCPACCSKCKCGKCPLPIKGFSSITSERRKNSRIKSNKLQRHKEIHKKVSSLIKPAHGHIHKETNNSETSERKLIFSETMLASNMVNIAERKKDPQYGEVICPESFCFTNYKPNYNYYPMVIPYCMPISNKLYQNENRLLIHNERYIQYAGYQSIFPYSTPLNLHEYYRGCEQMQGCPKNFN